MADGQWTVETARKHLGRADRGIGNDS